MLNDSTYILVPHTLGRPLRPWEPIYPWLHCLGVTRRGLRRFTCMLPLAGGRIVVLHSGPDYYAQGSEYLADAGTKRVESTFDWGRRRSRHRCHATPYRAGGREAHRPVEHVAAERIDFFSDVLDWSSWTSAVRAVSKKRQKARLSSATPPVLPGWGAESYYDASQSQPKRQSLASDPSPATWSATRRGGRVRWRRTGALRQACQVGHPPAPASVRGA